MTGRLGNQVVHAWGARDVIGRVLKDPLLHFVVLGALFFAVYGVMNPAPTETPLNIRVGAADIAGIEQRFQATWRRPPTAAELQGLVENYIREEVLVREGEALGMDRDDPVIRQRLRQKMEFLLSSGATAMTPSDADLEAWVKDNSDRFAVAGQVAFEQVYLGQYPTQEDVDAVQGALAGGADYRTLGERTLLPEALPLSHPIAIDSTFGAGFAGALQDLPKGEWAGPLTSGYGTHLVRVTDKTGARLPPLEEIRDRAEAGWRAEQAETLTERLYQDLRARYTIDIEDGA